jgi:hypothetical protein
MAVPFPNMAGGILAGAQAKQAKDTGETQALSLLQDTARTMIASADREKQREHELGMMDKKFEQETSPEWADAIEEIAAARTEGEARGNSRALLDKMVQAYGPERGPEEFRNAITTAQRLEAQKVEAGDLAIKSQKESFAATPAGQAGARYDLGEVVPIDPETFDKEDRATFVKREALRANEARTGRQLRKEEATIKGLEQSAESVGLDVDKKRKTMDVEVATAAKKLQEVEKRLQKLGMEIKFFSDSFPEQLKILKHKATGPMSDAERTAAEVAQMKFTVGVQSQARVVTGLVDAVEKLHKLMAEARNPEQMRELNKQLSKLMTELGVAREEMEDLINPEVEADLPDPTQPPPR